MTKVIENLTNKLERFMVRKYDGVEVKFNASKIALAISKADIFSEINENEMDRIVTDICSKIYSEFIPPLGGIVSVKEIHETVEQELKETHKPVWIEYSTYRRERDENRLMNSELMNAIRRLGINTDRDNGNVGNNFSAKLLRVASEANKAYNLGEMPKEYSKMHQIGDVHIHDLDSYNLTTNCLHNDTLKILQKSFNTGYGTIRSPKRITSATELVCILIQSCQNK